MSDFSWRSSDFSWRSSDFSWRSSDFSWRSSDFSWPVRHARGGLASMRLQNVSSEETRYHSPDAPILDDFEVL
ncbi:MAG: hypothetical protein MUF49_15710 [Oculatellaceae cyanobacterium Prado106]|jgi:hypothetical protein|nr:hypothetical protein [Oculatellaceae cyanobacterium Prado106]